MKVFYSRPVFEVLANIKARAERDCKTIAKVQISAAQHNEMRQTYWELKLPLLPDAVTYGYELMGLTIEVKI